MSPGAPGLAETGLDHVPGVRILLFETLHPRSAQACSEPVPLLVKMLKK